ncbi:hypothetical protein ACFS4T_15050 [Pseudomonas lini]
MSEVAGIMAPIKGGTVIAGSKKTGHGGPVFLAMFHSFKSFF